MEEDILQQDVDDGGLEDDMDDLEKDVEQEQKSKKKVKQVAQPEEQVGQQAGQQPSEKINETYEAFITQPRMGIVNTLTGEVIEGFDIEKDQAIVQLGKLILNKLDKIATACGA